MFQTYRSFISLLVRLIRVSACLILGVAMSRLSATLLPVHSTPVCPSQHTCFYTAALHACAHLEQEIAWLRRNCMSDNKLMSQRNWARRRRSSRRRRRRRKQWSPSSLGTHNKLLLAQEEEDYTEDQYRRRDCWRRTRPSGDFIPTSSLLWVQMSDRLQTEHFLNLIHQQISSSLLLCPSSQTVGHCAVHLVHLSMNFQNVCGQRKVSCSHFVVVWPPLCLRDPGRCCGGIKIQVYLSESIHLLPDCSIKLRCRLQ